MAFEPKPQPTTLPVIASDDYDDFKHILGAHILDAYDEWLNLFAQWVRDWGCQWRYHPAC